LCELYADETESCLPADIQLKLVLIFFQTFLIFL